jgi:hypothetical protein
MSTVKPSHGPDSPVRSASATSANEKGSLSIAAQAADALLGPDMSSSRPSCPVMGLDDTRIRPGDAVGAPAA